MTVLGAGLWPPCTTVVVAADPPDSEDLDSFLELIQKDIIVLYNILNTELVSLAILFYRILMV